MLEKLKIGKMIKIESKKVIFTSDGQKCFQTQTIMKNAID